MKPYHPTSVKTSANVMNKIKELPELVERCCSLRKRGKKIGLITGCFDTLHIGHIRLFKFAKKKVDYLIVGLDSDESIRVNKGEGRPVFGYHQRAEVLAAMQDVDFVFEINNHAEFDFVNPPAVYRSIISQLKPHFLITNAETDKYWQNKKRDAEEAGAKLILFRYKTPTSSSTVIKR
jgi:D-beta-D-heptose 7-phosphate kinase/D-beta-D-heptose 1-phosphate adenosyltransferase